MSVGECQRRRSLRLLLALFPDILSHHIPGRTSQRGGKVTVRPEYRLQEVLFQFFRELFPCKPGSLGLDYPHQVQDLNFRPGIKQDVDKVRSPFSSFKLQFLSSRTSRTIP